MRLLLNAEPFGFGPTAAIAAVMPHLAPHASHIGYVGSGHTTDLQRPLPYHAFHTPEDVPWEQYDTFLTALDFGMAEQAHAHGLATAIYDPLTWYWPTLPPIIGKSLYLAQSYYGVEDRIKAHPESFGRVQVVPPLVTLRPPQAHRSGVLINLGGLQNPLWPIQHVQTYALSMALAIRQLVPATEPLTLTTSVKVADYLRPQLGHHLHITSLPHHEIQDVMAGYRAAFMTPGLGNMYDASAHAIPTVWLPPANDSQGQQLDVLRQHNHADAWVDWADLGHPTPYKGEQQAILTQLAAAISTLASSAAQHQLTQHLATAWHTVNTTRHAKISGLVETFGHDGASHIAQAMLKHLQPEPTR